MRAERQFTMQDQQRFALLSGDANPMHMDAVAARRTTAGAPVVHGIHGALWCLDVISESLGELPPVSGLRVNFDTFVAVGETVEMVLLKRDAGGLRVVVRASGVPALTLALTFGDMPAPNVEIVSDGEFFDGAEPLELTLEQMAACRGQVGLATTEAAMSDAFPHAARLLGASRVAGLGALTRLVGMVCPGLNSIFNGVSLQVCPIPDEGSKGIVFRVDQLDLRYRRLVQGVYGCGWRGTVTCSARHPPTPQPSMEFLAGLIAPDVFRGATALIVGGSRGLGELTAKLIAAGGGRVIVTYATGRADAESLTKSINAAGGSASALCYDVLKDPHPQLASIESIPTHLYYFATPTIAGRRSTVFSAERFARFIKFYVTGFSNLLDALQASRPGGLRVLYPSTVFIDERPAGMTEYAMAKAAGEVLCADLAKDRPSLRIEVPRLPRLPTDQTASLQSVETSDAVVALLPYINALHSS